MSAKEEWLHMMMRGLVGWIVMAFSAQTGYIMPWKS